ncbi:hypothetical protein ScPMuIL_015268 [Solemya velum]
MGESTQVDVIIKLGGSSITEKEQLETLKLESLRQAAALVHTCVRQGLVCVIVHGAGSFGHHHAKKFGINDGSSHLPPESQAQSRIGFCQTHLAVTKLSHLVSDCLVENGVPAVTVSPCSTWKTRNGAVETSCIQPISDLVLQGFVPVIHGDCVLDSCKGSAILSGDTIIKCLCSHYSVSRVVFLTDVDGVYNNPPECEGSTLLSCISVSPNRHLNVDIGTSKNECDVTGGIMLKLQSAIDIVLNSKGLTPVFVCKIGSESAKEACCDGKITSKSGTVLHLENS